MMEPSEDPYPSALNFVRAIRKYQTKNGIISKELSSNSYYGNHMLRIKFDDNTYISIRKAGNLGRQTPNDQVTVGIRGSKFGKNERKFKFPEIKGIKQMELSKRIFVDFYQAAVFQLGNREDWSMCGLFNASGYADDEV